MPIDITGLFQPSGGPGSFDLYSPEDIQAGNINVVLTLISGGRITANGIVGEIIIQTGAGTPSHSASEGTPYWDTTNNKLYVNNNGSTGWTEIAAGGGSAHDILSATHGDVVVASRLRGDLLVANSTPAWARFAIGSSGTFLKSNGTDPAWTAIAYTDVGNVTQAKVLGRYTASTGAIELLTPTGGIELSGSDLRRSALTGDITATAGSGTTAFRSGSACSVLGRYAATSGAIADILAPANNYVLQRISDVVGFGPIVTDLISDSQITYAKIQNVTASRILGRGSAAGDGAPVQLELGTGLSFSGTTINASSSNSFTTIDCPAGTDPVADTSTDTLQLINGTGISITGANDPETVTIACTEDPATHYKIDGTRALTGDVYLGASTPATRDFVLGSVKGFSVFAPNNGVNYLQAYGVTTGNTPSLRATGSDANVGLDLYCRANSTATRAAKFSAATSAVNYLAIASTAAGTHPTITAVGSDTDVNLNLIPQGDGVLEVNGVDLTGIDDKLVGKWRTVTKIIYIENPLATDEFPICYFPDDCTITAVRAQTNVNTSTVTFNLNERLKTTPFSSGTNVDTTDFVADYDGFEQTGSFENAAMAADTWLYYVASAVANSPTKVIVSIEYTIN